MLSLPPCTGIAPSCTHTLSVLCVSLHTHTVCVYVCLSLPHTLPVCKRLFSSICFVLSQSQFLFVVLRMCLCIRLNFLFVPLHFHLHNHHPSCLLQISSGCGSYIRLFLNDPPSLVAPESPVSLFEYDSYDTDEHSLPHTPVFSKHDTLFLYFVPFTVRKVVGLRLSSHIRCCSC
jgi:hypothetical protein